MNEIVAAIGLEGWKPLVSALLLPPVPLLLLVLVGARLMLGRRLLGWLLILLGIVTLWLSATSAAPKLLQPVLLDVPAPLDAQEV